MTRFKHSFASTLLASAAALALAGCSGGGIFGSDDDDDRIESELDRSARVPNNAEVVASGRDQVLRYRAPSDGQVTLFDVQADRVIDQRGIRSGSEYIVAPEDDRAWIGDMRVLDYDMDEDREYRVYFVSNDRRSENGNREVPRSASIVREGRGDLSFEARGDGTVYVYDIGGRQVVGSTRLESGQRFTVSPTSGEATVDGRRVFRKELNEDKTYRLYFNSGAVTGVND